MTAPITTPAVDFDVIVVGAGIAGCVTAHQLARSGHDVLVVERGTRPGAKNLSGGVLYCRVLEEVWPDFVARAPIERVITRNCLTFLNPGSHVTVDYGDDRLADPVNAVSVLRARLDPWLATQSEEAGATVMPGMLVDELLLEGDRVVGIRAGDDELRSHVVVAADGANSFLCRAAGIRTQEPTRNVALGVKSVIALDRHVIEERFGLVGEEDGDRGQLLGARPRHEPCAFAGDGRHPQLVDDLLGRAHVRHPLLRRQRPVPEPWRGRGGHRCRSGCSSDPAPRGARRRKRR